MTRPQWVGVVSAGVLGLLLAILFYNRFGDGGIRVSVRTYDVSDRSVSMQFEVTKDKQQTVVCTLEARDRDGQQIGTALVRVGPSAKGSVLTSYDLATTARANTAEVTSCTQEP